MTRFLITTLLSLVTVSAHAVYCAKPDPSLELLPQLCRLYYRSGDPCSGVYLGDNKVLTAGHCVVARRARPVFVECVNGLRGPVTNVEVSPAYNPIDLADAGPELRAAVDLTLLTIQADKPESQGIKTVATRAEAYDLLAQGRCTMNGVGWSAQQTLGDFQVCPASPMVSQKENTWFLLNGENRGMSSDSGSPLICKNQNGENVLVGILSRGNNISETYYAPASAEALKLFMTAVSK